MDEFRCGIRIVSGPGALEALAGLEARRLLLITQPQWEEAGTAQQVAAAVGAERMECFHCPPEPTAELAAQAMSRLRAFAPDLCVALGDGGILDCAKAAVWFSGTDCPLAAVPTGSGSGAEVTGSVCLTHERKKHILRDRGLQPKLVILDPVLLEGLPGERIAAGGFELLANALEAYSARGAGAITDLYAREAFSTAYAALPASYAGRQGVRLKVHLASAMAGIAMDQAGTGLCRAMANALGGMFPVERGKLNAVLLPAVIRCNACAAGRKYAELARAAGMGGSADSIALGNLCSGLIRLRRELDLPETLAQAGIDPRTVWWGAGELVRRTLSDPGCAGNPMIVEDFLVRRILEEVTGRV